MDISIEVGSIVTVIITAWGGLWGIASKIRKEREAEAAKTLAEARKADAVIKAEMESKIRLLEEKLKNIEHSVAQDFAHLKETYNGALANLAQKIEELRSELKNQHGNLVDLLTELIKKK
jgi:hypothetical protein